MSGIFILLSASLNIEELKPLNWYIVGFLFALLFFVRPATILLSLAFSTVPWNERLFLAWIAPRGIVLVAISGLFALRLTELGYADGNMLIGFSFAVVVATIIAHGFTIDLVARWLKVKGDTRPGLLIVGSTPWSIPLAEQMHSLKTPVMIVDPSWQRLAPHAGKRCLSITAKFSTRRPNIILILRRFRCWSQRPITRLITRLSVMSSLMKLAGIRFIS